jgi:hypothetical protein
MQSRKELKLLCIYFNPKFNIMKLVFFKQHLFTLGTDSDVTNIVPRLL